MRGLALWALAVTAIAGPADQAVARWTLIEGGRVGIGGQVIQGLAELPAGDYQVEMVDWVAVNAVPEDLERMTGLRHLRELRLPGPLWNRNVDGGKDLSKLLKFLAPVTSLEKLTFSDHFLDRIRFRDSGLVEIASLTQLRELALRQAEVKGPGLRYFVNLQSLDVTLCPVADLEALAGMKGLRRLWAGDTFVSDLAPLAGLTELEDLDLHGTGVRDESVVHLARLRALRRLDLQGTSISDAAVATLEQLTNLETLNLYRTKISNAGLARLSTLTKLRDIDIRYTRVTAAGYDALRAALPRARVQYAGGGAREISKLATPKGRDPAALNAWVRAIGGTIRPEDGFVSLRGVPLDAGAIAALTRMPGLRVLDLEATDLGDAAMATLAGIGTLEELTLNNTQVSDAGLAALGGLRNLRRLRLNNTYVEGAAFAEWPEGSALEELSLLGTPANDVSIAGVARLGRLQRLVLAESDVTGPGLAALTALPLVHLDLSAADVSDNAPLDKFARLRSLRLRDTRITDLTLVRKLGTLKELESLDLARTRISNVGMEGIAKLTALRELDLSYAELDDTGLEKLAALQQLETLNLDSTNVTDGGVGLLTGFAKLRQLDLYHSLLTAKGLEKLRAALPHLRVVWDKEGGMPHRRRA
ncbi:MAG: leucine-rich repeat domain-containing protein [Bryobacteraceae bacterium]